MTLEELRKKNREILAIQGNDDTDNVDLLSAQNTTTDLTQDSNLSDLDRLKLKNREIVSASQDALQNTAYANGLAIGEEEGKSIKYEFDRNKLLDMAKTYSNEVEKSAQSGDYESYYKNLTLLQKTSDQINLLASPESFLNDFGKELDLGVKNSVADALLAGQKLYTGITTNVDAQSLADVYNNKEASATGNIATTISDLWKLKDAYRDDETIQKIFDAVVMKKYNITSDSFFSDVAPYVTDKLKELRYKESYTYQQTRDEKQAMEDLKQIESLSNYNGLGQTVLNSAGILSYMAPAIGAGIATGQVAGALGASANAVGIANQAGTLATMGVSAYGNAFDRILKEGYGWGKSGDYATAIAITEVFSEIIGGEAVMAGLGGFATHTLTSDVARNLIAKGKTPLAKWMIGTLWDIGAETLEEWFSDSMEPIYDRAILGKEITAEEYFRSLLESARDTVIPTLVLGGFGKARIVNHVSKINNALNAKLDLLATQGSITKQEYDTMKEDLKNWTNDAIAGVTEHYEEIKNEATGELEKRGIDYNDAMKQINDKLDTRSQGANEVVKTASRLAKIETLTNDEKQSLIEKTAKKYNIDNDTLTQLFGRYKEVFPYSYQQAEKTTKNRIETNSSAKYGIEGQAKAMAGKAILSELSSKAKPIRIKKNYSDTFNEFAKLYNSETTPSGFDRLVVDDGIPGYARFGLGNFNEKNTPTYKEILNSPILFETYGKNPLTGKTSGEARGLYIYDNWSDFEKDVIDRLGSMKKYANSIVSGLSRIITMSGKGGYEAKFENGKIVWVDKSGNIKISKQGTTVLTSEGKTKTTEAKKNKAEDRNRSGVKKNIAIEEDDSGAKVKNQKIFRQLERSSKSVVPYMGRHAVTQIEQETVEDIDFGKYDPNHKPSTSELAKSPFLLKMGYYYDAFESLEGLSNFVFSREGKSLTEFFTENPEYTLISLAGYGKIYYNYLTNTYEIMNTGTGEVKSISLPKNKSDGLTKGQKAFFEKVAPILRRGKKLVNVYHTTTTATDEPWYKFMPKRFGKQAVAFFSSLKRMSDSYSATEDVAKLTSKGLKKPRRSLNDELSVQYEGYLNMQNPFVVDALGKNWQLFDWKFNGKQYHGSTEDLVYQILNYNRDLVFKDTKMRLPDYKPTKWYKVTPSMDPAREMTQDEILEAGGYDGIVVLNVYDFGRKSGEGTGDDYVIFNSNQFKLKDNPNPTKNPNFDKMPRETKSAKSNESKIAKQLNIIKKYNPAKDDIHTAIREVGDIKTYEETLSNASEVSVAPDYTYVDAVNALRKGEVTVYSSKPITQGTFVTPSKMEAQNYAGNGKIYSKQVSLSDVAWIGSLQGQYAKVEAEKEDNIDRLRKATAMEIKEAPIVKQSESRLTGRVPIIEGLGETSKVKMIDMIKHFLGGRYAQLTGPQARTSFGTFNKKSKWVRNSEITDVDTAFHELGHYIHTELLDNLKEFDEDVEKELIKLADERFGAIKNKNEKLREGFAEAVRLWVEDRVYFINNYRKIAEMFVAEKDGTKEIRKAFDFLDKLQNEVIKYVNMDPNLKFKALSQDAFSDVTIDNALTRLGTNIIYNAFNTEVYANKFDRYVAKLLGIKYKDRLSIDKIEDWFRMAGNGQMIGYQLNDGITDFDAGKKITHGLNEIFDTVKATEKDAKKADMKLKDLQAKNIYDLGKYAQYRRILYLYEHPTRVVKDLGMSLLEAQEGMKMLVAQSYLDEEQLIKGSDMINEDSQALINYAYEKGKISKEQRDQLLEDNMFYAPLNRVIQGMDDSKNKRGSRSLNKKIFHRLEGSDLQLENPFISLANNWGSIIRAIDENNVSLKLKAIEQEVKDAGGDVGLWFETDVAPKMLYKGDVSLEAFKPQLREMFKQIQEEQKIDLLDGNLVELMDLDATASLFGLADIDETNRIISYMDKGVRKYIQFTDNDWGRGLFNLLAKTDMQNETNILDYFNELNAPLKLGATGMNIEFALGNMQSDAMMRYITSDANFINRVYFPVITNVVNAVNFMKHKGEWLPGWHPTVESDMYKKFVQSGVAQSGKFKATLDNLRSESDIIYGEYADAVFKNVRKRKKRRRLSQVMTESKVGKFLSWMPEISEQATRFAEFSAVYNKMIKDGKSESVAIREAGMKARLVTQDFTVQGKIMRQVNKIVPFASATVGGLYRMGQEARNHPERFTARMAGLATFTLFLSSLIKDDDRDWYEEINAQKRYDNFIIPNPADKQHPIILKKPQGPARCFVNLVQLFYDGGMGYIPEGKADDAFLSWLTKSIEEVAPVTSVVDTIPGGVQGFVENAVNYDFYYKTPIVSDELKKLDPRHQYDEYTSEMAKIIGNIFNWSPKKIDNAYNQWFAGVGKQLSGGFDIIVRGLTGRENQLPSKDLSEYPGLTRVFANTFRNSTSVDELYTRIEELEREKAEGRMTEEQQEEYDKLQTAKSSMAQYTKKIKAVRNDGSLTAQQKKDKIDKLQEQRIDTARYYQGKRLLNSSNKSTIEATEFYPSQDTYTYTVGKTKYEIDMSDEKVKNEYAEMFKKEYEANLKKLRATAEYKNASATEKAELEKKAKSNARTATTNKMKKIVYQRNK